MTHVFTLPLGAETNLFEGGEHWFLQKDVLEEGVVPDSILQYHPHPLPVHFLHLPTFMIAGCIHSVEQGFCSVTFDLIDSTITL